MEDWEHSETECPQCGHATRTSDCSALTCVDGFVDEYDNDSYFRPGLSFTICFECVGTGGHHWCPDCGWDLVAKCYGNRKPIAADINED